MLLSQVSFVFLIFVCLSNPTILLAIVCQSMIYCGLLFRCFLSIWLRCCNPSRISMGPSCPGYFFTCIKLSPIAISLPLKPNSFFFQADLIVYAGHVALEEAAGISMVFCPGRTDYTNARAGDVKTYHLNVINICLHRRAASAARVPHSRGPVARHYQGDGTHEVSCLRLIVQSILFVSVQL
jgi:hypothetical protein